MFDWNFDEDEFYDLNTEMLCATGCFLLFKGSNKCMDSLLVKKKIDKSYFNGLIEKFIGSSLIITSML